VDEISFDVPGYPPLKGEALSVFNAAHGQAERIRTLLQAAQFACEERGFAPVELTLAQAGPRSRRVCGGPARANRCAGPGWGRQ
jgi:hypothetical protein